MGTYVYFYVGDSDGIKSTFSKNMHSLNAYLQNINAEFPDDFPEEMMTMSERLMGNWEETLNASTETEAHLIDRVADELLEYGRIEGKNIFREVTPSAHKRYRYASDITEVIPTARKSTVSYYCKLFSGRSIIDFPEHFYKSNDDVYHLSWLLPQEVKELLNHLESYNLDFNIDDERTHGIRWIYESLKEADSANSSLVVEIA